MSIRITLYSARNIAPSTTCSASELNLDCETSILSVWGGSAGMFTEQVHINGCPKKTPVCAHTFDPYWNHTCSWPLNMDTWNEAPDDFTLKFRVQSGSQLCGQFSYSWHRKMQPDTGSVTIQGPVSGKSSLGNTSLTVRCFVDLSEQAKAEARQQTAEKATANSQEIKGEMMKFAQGLLQSLAGEMFAKVTEEDKAALRGACEAAVAWLNANQAASGDQIQYEKQKLDVGIVNPMLQRLEQEGKIDMKAEMRKGMAQMSNMMGGMMGGMMGMGGGMPGMGGMPGNPMGCMGGPMGGMPGMGMGMGGMPGMGMQCQMGGMPGMQCQMGMCGMPGQMGGMPGQMGGMPGMQCQMGGMPGQMGGMQYQMGGMPGAMPMTLG
ncbi:hypothetical protein Pelo_11292 [Pelomyxa schiedti]|nr:hypothetical protein Pelo_11292 [Pelomyxa schiedti]